MLLVLVLTSLCVVLATVWIFETEDADDFTHWKSTEKKKEEKQQR